MVAITVMVEALDRLDEEVVAEGVVEDGRFVGITTITLLFSRLVSKILTIFQFSCTLSFVSRRRLLF